MRLLLDSHTVIWAADDPTQLSVLAQQLIQDPSHDRLISAATIWEMAIKFGLKKLPLSLPYRQWMDKAIADLTGNTQMSLGTVSKALREMENELLGRGPLLSEMVLAAEKLR